MLIKLFHYIFNEVMARMSEEEFTKAKPDKKIKVVSIKTGATKNVKVEDCMLI